MTSVELVRLGDKPLLDKLEHQIEYSNGRPTTFIQQAITNYRKGNRAAPILVFRIATELLSFSDALRSSSKKSCRHCIQRRQLHRGIPRDAESRVNYFNWQTGFSTKTRANASNLLLVSARCQSPSREHGIQEMPISVRNKSWLMLHHCLLPHLLLRSLNIIII